MKGRMWIILAVFMFVIVAVPVSIALKSESYMYIQELERPDRGTGERRYELEVVCDDGAQQMELYVGERRLSESELEEVFTEAEELLKSRMLGENPNFQDIERPLKIISSIPEYNMQVSWHIDNQEVIDYWGEIHQTRESQPVVLTATMRYEGRAGAEALTSREYSYGLTVSPYSGSQLFTVGIQQLFEAADRSSDGENSIVLPDEYEGRKLRYRVRKDNSMLGLLLLVPIIPVILVFEKRSIEQSRKKRVEEQLVREYPELISKLCLLTGAGMTPYNALCRICTDGKGEVYRRLSAVIGNIKSGASERSQYAAFGEIFGLYCYSRLGSMLEQNVVRGNEKLRGMLREECMEALEDRRARARKAGEQAGTKLLFPMMLMLLVVLVVIMVPAFMSMEGR